VYYEIEKESKQCLYTVNLFWAWCDFSLKQHSQKRGGIERSLNDGALKTKRPLCLWECTSIAVHTLEFTDYASSSGYIYTVDVEITEPKVNGGQNKYNVKK